MENPPLSWRDSLGVAVSRHVDRPSVSKRLVVEEPVVDPSGAFVKRPGAQVGGYNRKPSLPESKMCYLLLSCFQEPLRDTAAAVLCADVNLLDFIGYHHAESRDQVIDGSDRRIGDTLRRPLLKGVERPRCYQFLGDSTEVAIPPASAPDRGNTLGIVIGSGSEKNHALARGDATKIPNAHVSFDLALAIIDGCRSSIDMADVGEAVVALRAFEALE
jgi:hypothetical protein